MPTLNATADACLTSTSTLLRPLAETVQTYEIFDGLSGWKWDDMHWLAPRARNDDATLPALMDPEISGLPSHIFQSGIGSEKDLKLIEVKDIKHLQSWVPRVRHGTYFVHKDRFWLYSEDSVMMTAGRDQNSDSQSQVDLWFMPKPGVPITAAYLSYDNAGNIIWQTEFKKVAKFTGTIANGVERDPDLDVNNIDTTKDEFVVTYRPGNVVREELLSMTEPGAFPGVASGVLSLGPISKLEFSLSRPDIFVRELSFDEFVARQQAATLVNGDYFVGYQDSTAPDGAVQVYVTATHSSYGNCTFASAYPATVTFNRDVVDARANVDLGAADATDNQVFRLDRFPIHDQSTRERLDTWSFQLSVVGDADPWARVQDLSTAGAGDKVFELDSEYGIITFGDGVNGAKPAFGLTIRAVSYSVVPLIEYEPIGSSDEFIDEAQNLDPTSNSLLRGFIYLSNKVLTIDHLHLVAPLHNVNAATGNLGPVTAGQELIFLTARVHNLAHEPIPNIEVRFDASPAGKGAFVASTVRSNGQGEVYAQFLPESGVENMTNLVNFYESEADVTALELGYPEGKPAIALAAESDPAAVGTNEIVDRDASALFSPALAWSGTGPAWQNNAIVVQGDVNGTNDRDGISTLNVYAVLNDDPMNPYSNLNRTGGRGVIFAYFTGDGDARTWHILRPVAILKEGDASVLVFDRNLTTKFGDIGRSVIPSQDPVVDTATGHYNVMQYAVIGDQVLNFTAQTVDSPVVSSDPLSFDVTLPASQKGPWTIPTGSDDTGSALTANTWLFLNSGMRINSCINNDTGLSSGPAAGGYTVRIFGAKMPIDEELKPNVWVNGTLVPREDIFLRSALHMEITMPAGDPGEVEILVGSRPIDIGAGSEEQPRTCTFTYL